jgi:hypothetical protein
MARRERERSMKDLRLSFLATRSLSSPAERRSISSVLAVSA